MILKHNLVNQIHFLHFESSRYPEHIPCLRDSRFINFTQISRLPFPHSPKDTLPVVDYQAEPVECINDC